MDKVVSFFREKVFSRQMIRKHWGDKIKSEPDQVSKQIHHAVFQHNTPAGRMARLRNGEDQPLEVSKHLGEDGPFRFILQEFADGWSMRIDSFYGGELLQDKLSDWNIALNRKATDYTALDGTRSDAIMELERILNYLKEIELLLVSEQLAQMGHQVT